MSDTFSTMLPAQSQALSIYARVSLLPLEKRFYITDQLTLSPHSLGCQLTLPKLPTPPPLPPPPPFPPPYSKRKGSGGREFSNIIK